MGQGILMHTYEKLFAEYGQIVAQVLLTKTESLDRHRYTNSRNTFMELLKNRVIPIVNENDVVALDELKIGDNDNMSALVAGIVDADLVVILSDVDGLYTANPQTHPDAKLVSIVSDITPEIELVPVVLAAAWVQEGCLPRSRRLKPLPVQVSICNCPR